MGKKRKPYTKEELAEIASQYHELPVFRKEQHKAYDAIRERGLLDEMCGHMKRGQRKKYTDEELKAIASQYSTSAEFIQNEKNAYYAISRRGLLDELCGHMKREVVSFADEELAAIAKDYNDLHIFKAEQPNAYAAIVRRGKIKELCGHMKRRIHTDYTDEELAAIASRYNDITQFKKKQRQPYFAIHRRGKFDELCGHMKRNMRKAYTEEELRDIALKHKTKKEFREKHAAVYLAAHKRGILDDVCSHMEEVRRAKGFYSKGYCRVVALDYKTRKDFQKGNGYAYHLAVKEGWIDEICSHMERQGNWFFRKIYVFEFSDGYAYVGLAKDPEGRYKDHMKGKKNSPILPHIKQTGATFEHKLLTDWLPKDEAAKVEDEYIKKYRADGWKMLNKAKGGALGGDVNKKNSAKAIRTIVSRYEYVEDFRDGEPEVYEQLCDNRQFSKYCAGLKRRKKPMGYWDLETALAVIPECETREIFNKRYYQAYRMVKAAGLLDKYYPEKVKPKRKWTLEACATAARYCETKAEFRKKHRRAYERLKKKGLLDELFEDKQ